MKSIVVILSLLLATPVLAAEDMNHSAKIIAPNGEVVTTRNSEDVRNSVHECRSKAMDFFPTIRDAVEPDFMSEDYIVVKTIIATCQSEFLRLNP